MGKKILSLDGGGSWAILQAMALKNIYQGTPVGTKCINILNQFDVISANSGGSLMLAGMISKHDQDIEEVIQMFLSEKIRKKVFRKRFNFLRIIGLGPKYRAKEKLNGLKRALGEVGDLEMWKSREEVKLSPHIVICGFDYDMQRAVFFKTDQEESKKRKYTLANAINASSNAPVNYFDAPVKSVYDDDKIIHRFWDGAIGGNNNPTLIGITEAFVNSNCNCDLSELEVLSIGTGNNLLPVEGFTEGTTAVHKSLMVETKKARLTRDIKKMGVSIISEPPEAANFMAHIFLGGKLEKGSRPAVVRMNALIQPVLQNGGWDFPQGVEKDVFRDLIDLEMDAVEQHEVEKIEKLGNWWMEGKTQNQGISYNGKNFTVKIGFDKFPDAKEEWLERSGIETTAPHNDNNA